MPLFIGKTQLPEAWEQRTWKRFFNSLVLGRKIPISWIFREMEKTQNA
jgi:hypothetical protein